MGRIFLRKRYAIACGEDNRRERTSRIKQYEPRHRPSLAEWVSRGAKWVYAGTRQPRPTN